MGMLTDHQRDMIMDWLRHGFNGPEIVKMAEQHGFSVTKQNVYANYVPKLKEERENALKNSEKGLTWFDKRFRAERAAEIADRLYNDIMNGKMYAEEVTEMDVAGGTKTTRKPVYFAGMVKNWTDLVNTIRTELNQNKQTVDINYNKSANVNISLLIDKIYEEDDKVRNQLESADIIDVPSDSDFGDDKAYLAIVNDQTSDEVRELTENEDEDDEDYYIF